MKKSLLALAAMTAFAGAASAQSSVTLFGIMDVGLRSVKNGTLGSIKSEVSGSNSTSRFGFRGSEDLGGGTSAQFWLESGINADAGANASTTSFFDRRSTVSLVNATAGEVRLGRDYRPTHTVMGYFDPFGLVGIGNANQFNNFTQAVRATVTPAANSGSVDTVRANNAVEYFLPANLGGFNGAVIVTAGEGAASSTAGNAKSTGVRLGYAAGPINVAATTISIKNVTAAQNQTFKDTAFGGSYDFGVVKLAAARRTFTYQAEKASVTLLAFTAPLGQGTLKASYLKVNQAGSVPLNDATQLTAGYVYDLSKRTALYGTVGRISNKGTAVFVIPGGPAVTAATFGGQKSTGYEFGVRHSF